MGAFESPNVETPEGIKTKMSENLKEKTPEIENKWVYLAIPIVAIALAELMIYSGRKLEAMYSTSIQSKQKREINWQLS